MSEWSGKIAFSGTVTDKGTVKPDEVNVTRGRLSRWKGRRVSVTVTKYVKPKSNPQLGLYFRETGILDAWCDYVGDDRDSVHKDLKDAFLAPVLAVSKITGEESMRTPSLADLNVEEMSAFIERLLREGAQRGIVFDLRETA